MMAANNSSPAEIKDFLHRKIDSLGVSRYLRFIEGYDCENDPNEDYKIQYDLYLKLADRGSVDLQISVTDVGLIGIAINAVHGIAKHGRVIAGNEPQALELCKVEKFIDLLSEGKMVIQKYPFIQKFRVVTKSFHVEGLEWIRRKPSLVFSHEFNLRPWSEFEK